MKNKKSNLAIVQKPEAPTEPLKLDLGCSIKKNPGYIGVDIRPFEGVDVVCDLSKAPWPWEDNSVDEVHCCHFLEHLTGEQRITFYNELHRVMKKGAQARIITPHWSHARAYGDPTHQWPPVCEWSFYYLEKAWRETQAPHTDYTCDFSYSLVGVHDPQDTYVAHRNMETKIILMSRSVNTTADLIATLTKK